jgi:hypothetical protein
MKNCNHKPLEAKELTVCRLCGAQLILLSRGPGIYRTLKEKP